MEDHPRYRSYRSDTDFPFRPHQFLRSLLYCTFIFTLTSHEWGLHGDSSRVVEIDSEISTFNEYSGNSLAIYSINSIEDGVENLARK